ncbi:SH3 domain-containing protein [Ascosphaera apis ARSEF 7405]|uniref:SH3 domain-containing protein n=1 Tax=Ascosphaera apis ARSEF 7405 TaxID=392613 RepID=A0A167Y817_9EURO|nr:SH3 domain-containing protein [Ascosphaera apis ARSEF 7405]
MTLEPPQLPTKFPCWCQAIYSWGGETKKDLGFVEGDLIECLNAGDGAWWMGRLRRDQRMVGLFPSNFVRVLSENFAPEKTRRVSTNEQPVSQLPQKQKTLFRKPFQGYKEAVGPSEALRQKKEEAFKTSIIQSVRKRSATHHARPTTKHTSRRSISPAPAPASSSAVAPGSAAAAARAASPLVHTSQIQQQVALHRAQSPAPAPVPVPVSTVHHQKIAPHATYGHPPPRFPPSPFSGASNRSPLPQSFIPQPLRPPSPALSPSRTPLHTPSQNLQLQPANVPYHHAPNQYTRNDPIYTQGSRKRSGTFPRPRQPDFRTRPSLHPISTRLAPPEPLAPASPEKRAPSPNSIFARVASPVALNYVDSTDPAYASYPGEHSLASYSSSGYDYDPELENDQNVSPPPPPPPPHRNRVQVLHQQQQSDQILRPESSALVVRTGGGQQRYDTNLRTPSPNVGRKSAEYGTTPSPLRDAMEDVMSSLHDMGMPRDGAPSPEVSPDPYQPWSSEEFDRNQDSSRPTTSGGRPPTRDSWKAGNVADTTYNGNNTSYERFQDGPPQLNNYVQRMESRLRQLHAQNSRKGSDELHLPRDGAISVSGEAEDTLPPLPSTLRQTHMYSLSEPPSTRMAKRRSAFDVIGRTGTNKSNATSSSSGMQSTITSSSTSTTDRSLMSGMSAGGISATSAGSYARRGGGGGAEFGTLSRGRPNTSMDFHHRRSQIISRPDSPSTGVSYHSSHNTSRQGAASAVGWLDYRSTASSSVAPTSITTDSERAPKDPLKKKSGFFRKMIESARSSAANARSSSPTKSRLGNALSHSRLGARSSTRELGLAADWIQVRRDVNRAMTPSKPELIEKAERCQMMDFPVIYAIEDLYTTAEGDEGIDGLPIEEPTNWNVPNMKLVDKSTRYLSNIPSNLSPAMLAQSYVCRSHRSDGQRLRAIFTWVAEKIIWDEDVDEVVDVRRVIQMRRGSSREVALLVQEMCSAIGIHSEVVEGYLKTPGEDLDLDSLSHANHWWNAVLVDGEWRIMDCSLASPTHPSRSLLSDTAPNEAESWYFLARPMEICYSHVPLIAEQQHIVPMVANDVLLALPTVTPIYFKCGLSFPSYDTSVMRIEGLEAVQIRIEAPFDIECAAEVETQAFSQGIDSVPYHHGEVVVKRALAQPDWCQGRKRYTIKAVLPEKESHGVLKVYAGKRGLMLSSKEIPYPLAFAIPITHTGDNPPYDFVLRHPTPHAQQRDLYIVQPQCSKLAINNTFVFTEAGEACDSVAFGQDSATEPQSRQYILI